MRRLLIKYSISFKHRLTQEAQRLRDEPMKAGSPREREALLRMARQTEANMHVKEWLTSPGLQRPT